MKMLTNPTEPAPFGGIPFKIFAIIAALAETIQDTHFKIQVGVLSPGLTRGYPGIVSEGISGVTEGISGLTRGYPGLTRGYPGLAMGYPGLTMVYPGLTRGYPV